MRVVRTRSAEETIEAGERLGRLLQPGDVLCLSGDLGAGKTAFVQGIGRALGIRDYITSPTFTLVNEYEGRMPLCHFDVYRIGSVDEMDEIGFEEYFDRGGVVVIEWAELIEELLPKETIRVVILREDKPGSEDERSIHISFYGNTYKEYEERHE